MCRYARCTTAAPPSIQWYHTRPPQNPLAPWGRPPIRVAPGHSGPPLRSPLPRASGPSRSHHPCRTYSGPSGRGGGLYLPGDIESSAGGRHPAWGSSVPVVPYPTLRLFSWLRDRPNRVLPSHIRRPTPNLRPRGPRLGRLLKWMELRDTRAVRATILTWPAIGFAGGIPTPVLSLATYHVGLLPPGAIYRASRFSLTALPRPAYLQHRRVPASASIEHRLRPRMA